MEGELARPVDVRVNANANTASAIAQVAALNREIARGGNLNVGNLSAGQAASVLAATQSLQGASERLAAARTALNEVTEREGHTDEELAAASRLVTQAQQKEELAALRLAAAQETVASAQQRAADKAQKAAADQAKAAAETNATTKATTHNTSLLRDALLLIGPAAVPIGAVLAGGLAGAVPVAATLALGIKGISDELKSGQLAGTQYAADISSLKDEFTTLKSIAAGGLLSGIDQALQASSPLFSALNQDIGVMSKQLGSIVAGAAPALLNILNSLNPLFVTFGNLIASGAQKLEHFATSSTGIQSFVAYVQNELPTVVHAIGQLVEFAGRLVQALAPFGHVILSGIGLLASALNAIPQGVLTDLATGALAAYAAFRTYQTINGIVTSVSAALATNAAAAAAYTEQQQASALLVANAARQEAVAVTEARLAEARAAEASAAQIAAALAGTGSILEAEAIAAAEAAVQFTVAMEAEAAAAVASAAEISTAAVGAAETTVAAGRTASVGFAGILGPIGAVAVGIGLLFGVMNSGNQTEQKMTENINSLTSALVASKGALDETIRSNVAKTLSDEGAYQTAAKLGIQQDELTTAILSGGEALDKVRGKIKAALLDGTAFTKTGFFGGKNGANLAGQFEDEITGLSKAAKAAHDQQVALDGGTAAVLRNAHAFGTTADAYLTAQQAAQKNIDKSREQTLQWQLENDAGSILQQTLDKLSGKNLGYAQSLNSFQQSLVTMAQGLKSGSKAVTGLSQAAIANRGALLASAADAEQAAENYGKMTGSSVAARSKLIELRQQLIDNAVAHGEDRQAVTDYINSVLKIPKTVPPTKLDVDKAAAQKKIDDLKARIKAIKQGEVPGLDVNSKEAQGLIRQLQAQINRLQGKSVPIAVTGVDAALAAIARLAGAISNVAALGAQNHLAGIVASRDAGGLASGGGAPEGWFAVGEQGPELVHKTGSTARVFSNSQSKAIVAATGMRAPGFAGGTGDIVTLTPGSSRGATGGAARTASGSRSSSGPTAAQLDSLRQALAGLASAAASFGSSASALVSAANSVRGSARSYGASAAELARLSAETAQLRTLGTARDQVRARLGTPAGTSVTAYDRLASAKDAYNTAKTSGGAISAFDITTSGVRPQIYNDRPAPPVSATTILQDLAAKVQKAQRFSYLVRRLTQLGLPKSFVEQFIQAGPDAADQAEALIKASPKQLASIRADVSALDKAALSAGTAVANKFYKPGVDAAQGIVTGLLSKESALNAAIKRLGDGMVAELKHTLKIKSPSQVMHGLGAFTAEGFRLGVASKHDAVTREMNKLTQHKGSRTTQHGGITVHQTINPAPGMDEIAIGAVASRRLASLVY